MSGFLTTMRARRPFRVHVLRRNRLSVGTALATLLVASMALFSICLGIGADNGQMKASFFILAFEGIVIALSLVIKSHYSGIRLFEPFTMVAAVFTKTRFLAPVKELGMGNF